MNNREWRRLRGIAEYEVDRLLKRLPVPIRERVTDIPVMFEPEPSEDLVADGVDPDLMGLFVGESCGEPSSDPLPPEILLFLGNILDEADGDDAVYRREVRKTLLHEIGHYLGLNEDDLALRDLE